VKIDPEMLVHLSREELTKFTAGIILRPENKVKLARMPSVNKFIKALSIVGSFPDDDDVYNTLYDIRHERLSGYEVLPQLTKAPYERDYDLTETSPLALVLLLLLGTESHLDTSEHFWNADPNLIVDYPSGHHLFRAMHDLMCEYITDGWDEDSTGHVLVHHALAQLVVTGALTPLRALYVLDVFKINRLASIVSVFTDYDAEPHTQLLALGVALRCVSGNKVIDVEHLFALLCDEDCQYLPDGVLVNAVKEEQHTVSTLDLSVEYELESHHTDNWFIPVSALSPEVVHAFCSRFGFAVI
jgi:hypothetical protein